jgi:hypothetical protein
MIYHDDWSNKISPDQLEIDGYIAPKCNDKTILFMGIGNSHLAIVCKEAKRIHGFSYGNNKEIDVARKLNLDNYIFTIQSKYSLNQDIYPNYLDFISDNNPFSFCKFDYQIDFLMKCYSVWLKKDGIWISHKHGIIWNQTKIKADELDVHGNYTLEQCKKFTEPYFKWTEENNLILLEKKC